jgi:hypothetical protein
VDAVLIAECLMLCLPNLLPVADPDGDDDSACSSLLVDIGNVADVVENAEANQMRPTSGDNANEIIKAVAGNVMTSSKQC